MKIEIYSAAIYLLKASKLLYRYDKKNSENLLNLSEKYLLDLENKNLKKEELENIDKYKKLLQEE